FISRPRPLPPPISTLFPYTTLFRSDGDALALAAGELDPALAHLGLIAVGEPHDEFVRVGRLGGGDHLALARTWPGIRDVLGDAGDRKSTRLNSSHQIISYAVFCLNK